MCDACRTVATYLEAFKYHKEEIMKELEPDIMLRTLDLAVKATISEYNITETIELNMCIGLAIFTAGVAVGKLVGTSGISNN